MHLINAMDQNVTVDGERFPFTAGTGIHTENCYKYGIEEFQQLGTRAGFMPRKCWTDEKKLFSLHFFAAE